MIHQPLLYGGGISGQVSDIEIEAKELVRTKKTLLEIMAHHTGKTPTQVEKDADRNYWMTAEEAKAYGIVDRVVNPREAVAVSRLGPVEEDRPERSESDF